ncbi:MAG: class I SAM-dependent methyltransferase [Actinomycetota bacterium]
MTAPETRILVENLGSIPAGRILVAGFGPEAAEAFIERGDIVEVFHLNLRAHRACSVRGVPSTFAPWAPGPPGYAAAAILLPKETERLRMLLSMAAGLVSPGGVVLVAGHNDAGIRSAPRHIGDLIGPTDVVDFRHHCRLLSAVVAKPGEPSSLDAWRTTWSTEARGRRFTAVGYPGVFASGRLDAGSALLLENLLIRPEARALDVGCGSGIVGAHLRAGGCLHVDCVDVDALALESTRQTTLANGLDGINVFASDVYSDAGSDYDLIVSNPPFHAGVRTASEAAVRLIREAPDRLHRRGELWIVANRFLDYARHLNEVFPTPEVIAEDTRYRVWRAPRP